MFLALFDVTTVGIYAIPLSPVAVNQIAKVVLPLIILQRTVILPDGADLNILIVVFLTPPTPPTVQSSSMSKMSVAYRLIWVSVSLMLEPG